MSDKNKGTTIEINFGGILICLLIILCVGEPDLLDAIIKRVGGY